MSPSRYAGARLDRPRADSTPSASLLYRVPDAQLPVRRPDVAGTLERILNGPRCRRRRRTGDPRDLAIVIDTAIEKDRSRRYATALDFAEDLRAMRMHEPIRARPVRRLHAASSLYARTVSRSALPLLRRPRGRAPRRAAAAQRGGIRARQADEHVSTPGGAAAHGGRPGRDRAARKQTRPSR